MRRMCHLGRCGVLIALLAVPTDASADAAYSVHREGSFQHSALEMITCAETLYRLIRPELRYLVGTAAEWKTLAGTPQDDVEAVTWVISARDTDAQSAEVKLMSIGATKADLDEAWGVIETCNKQR